MYWFQVWPRCGVSCIGFNFGHQVALLALVVNLASRCQMALFAFLVNLANFLHHQVYTYVTLLDLVTILATRWRYLHYLQVWPPGGASCIAILPWIALLAVSVGIELVSSSARVTSVKFLQKFVCFRHLDS